MSAVCFSARAMSGISSKSLLHSSGMNRCGVNSEPAPRISQKQSSTSKSQPGAWRRFTNSCFEGKNCAEFTEYADSPCCLGRCSAQFHENRASDGCSLTRSGFFPDPGSQLGSVGSHPNVPLLKNM